MNCFLVFALLEATCLGVIGKETIPVLIWNTKNIPVDFLAVSALQQIPYSSFQANYLNSFSPNNVLLFLQDQLGIEDLSSHPVELKNIASLIEDKHSLFLPSVLDPSFLEHDLPANHGYNVIHITPGSGIGGVTLKKDENNLVVVRIPSTVTNPSRSLALQKADEVVGEVMSKIGKLSDFTVVYTGKQQTEHVSAKSAEHVRLSRSLKQFISDVPDAVKGFYGTKCVLFYAKNNTSLFVKSKNRTIILNDRAENVISDCQATTSTLKLIYKDVDQGTSKLHVEYNFVLKSGRNWMLQDAKVFMDQERSQLLLPIRQMDSVPLKKSYACAQTITLRSNSSSTNETMYELYIHGLQVEAFSGNRTKFGDSWDCIGFFSIPIWMGLLTSLLFTLILAMGLAMLADVKTMDRFDDPKGKHVMVQSAVSD